MALPQTFYGSASVTVSGTTTTFPPRTVTASGSGTSTSIISQSNADKLALQVARKVANTALTNDINVINQTAMILVQPPVVPYYRQIEVAAIVENIKLHNDVAGYPNNFLFSNTLYESYRNSPFIELQYPDSTGTSIAVYSSVFFTKNTYMYSVLGTDLVLDASNVIINGSRTYIWDECIVNNIQVATDEFPLEKQLQFKPQYQTPLNTLTQIMRKVALLPVGVPNGYYHTNTVIRESIYIYYASSQIFLLIDSNDTTNSTTNLPQTSRPKLYIMQSPSNIYFKDININNLYLLKEQLQLPAGEQPPNSGNYKYIPLPDGFNYVVYTIPYDFCVYVVSTLDAGAITIQDGCVNTYEYVDPKYNSFLYDQFNI